MSDGSADGDAIREFFKKWPRFYYAVMLALGPALFVNLSAKGFLAKYRKSGTTLNVGSGPRAIAPEVVNVDVVPYPGVRVVAGAGALPFPDASVARLVNDNVLEHVEEPERAFAEANRVLESGGYAYYAIPFLYPYHSSPSDYTRWTKQGLAAICERHGLRVVESGVRAGPFSLLALWIAYLLASLFCFGSEKLYWALANVFLVLLFWVKLFDVAAARLPFSENLSSVLYVVAQKP